jgi:S1-C subfamily serine protease
VRRTQDEKAYPVRVIHVGHECDLALLEITAQADRFFASARPLALGALPAVRSEVFTYGYPTGGKRISFTRGVVSRIEMHRYVHTGNRSFLTVQTDAAINPGNSGGPVIQDEHVVGVSFQGNPRLENTGFFIPTPVVRHFLEDIEDGRYDGFITPDFNAVPLRSRAEREWLGSPRENQGVLIDAFLPGSRMAEHLRVDDIIYRVGNTTIGTDGTALFDGNRLHWSAALMNAQSGDVLEFEILRNRKTEILKFPVFPYNTDAAQGTQFDVRPKYRVYAGLVFTPLSRNYLVSLGRAGHNLELLYQLLHHSFEHPDDRRSEPVVLSHALPHSVNADLVIKGPAVVDRVNNVRVASMADLARGFEACSNGFHFIEFTSGQFEALDRAACDAAQSEILSQHGIAQGARQ